MGSIIIWALSTFPRLENYTMDYAGEIEKITVQATDTASAGDQVTPSGVESPLTWLKEFQIWKK